MLPLPREPLLDCMRGVSGRPCAGRPPCQRVAPSSTIPDDVAGHVEIVRQGALPVAAGENLHSVYEFKNYIHAGAVSFPEPDCSNCGGVTAYLKIAHLAEAHNLPVTTHGIHDIHVHLLAAVPNSSYLEVHGFGLEPYMANPLRIEHGEADDGTVGQITA